MKKLLFCLCMIYSSVTIAGTTNWYVDGSVYQTTTCSSGDDVTPPTPPTKYGYTFMGWKNTALIRGTWSQSGTPTPDNPIYPTFYQNGDLILRAVGTGNNIIQDVYNQDTGKITRNVGVKVLDGTEGWVNAGGTETTRTFMIATLKSVLPGVKTSASYTSYICSHLKVAGSDDYDTLSITSSTYGVRLGLNTIILPNSVTRVQDAEAWLAAQYAAGTPVTIYYLLETPVEENYTQN